MVIISWQCEFCGWMNDNNPGACHNCGGETTSRLVRGQWRDVTLKEPRPSSEWLETAQLDSFRER